MACVGFVSRHLDRDSALPHYRDLLLKKALDDLSDDPDVLAIYLGGSLAKNNFDFYSDVDLHTIVTPERKKAFVKEKRNRAKKWGDVLFYEDSNPMSPAVVAHYDSFVKVDSWYHSPEEMVSSIWLKDMAVLYDPHHIIGPVIKESSKLVYHPLPEDVEFWRSKLLAFIHETYRAVMREELYYALSHLDRIRWLMVSGWYMEMEELLDCSYGVWSKLEGKRSKLKDGQLSFLKSWDCSRDSSDIMNTMLKMIPEFLRLNKNLSRQLGMEEDEELIK